MKKLIIKLLDQVCDFSDKMIGVEVANTVLNTCKYNLADGVVCTRRILVDIYNHHGFNVTDKQLNYAIRVANNEALKQGFTMDRDANVVWINAHSAIIVA